MEKQIQCRNFIDAIINLRHANHEPENHKIRIQVLLRGGIVGIHVLGNPFISLSIGMNDGNGFYIRKKELKDLCSEDLREIQSFLKKMNEKDKTKNPGDKFNYITEL